MLLSKPAQAHIINTGDFLYLMRKEGKNIKEFSHFNSLPKDKVITEYCRIITQFPFNCLTQNESKEHAPNGLWQENEQFKNGINMNYRWKMTISGGNNSSSNWCTAYCICVCLYLSWWSFGASIFCRVNKLQGWSDFCLCSEQVHHSVSPGARKHLHLVCFSTLLFRFFL